MGTVVEFCMAKKQSSINLGKGFKRIYFSLAGIWILGWIVTVFKDPISNGEELFDFISLISLPIILYFILLFFINGFKK